MCAANEQGTRHKEQGTLNGRTQLVRIPAAVRCLIWRVGDGEMGSGDPPSPHPPNTPSSFGRVALEQPEEDDVGESQLEVEAGGPTELVAVDLELLPQCAVAIDVALDL